MGYGQEERELKSAQNDDSQAASPNEVEDDGMLADSAAAAGLGLAGAGGLEGGEVSREGGSHEVGGYEGGAEGGERSALPLGSRLESWREAQREVGREGLTPAIVPAVGKRRRPVQPKPASRSATASTLNAIAEP